MTNDNDMDVRMAKIEVRMHLYEKDHAEMKKEIKCIRQQISDLVASAKMTRWIIGLAIGIGPSLGVMIVKVVS